MKNTINKIQDIITLIKYTGKKEYIKNTNDKYTRIYHDYSETVDGFIKWKSDLESRLT